MRQKKRRKSLSLPHICVRVHKNAIKKAKFICAETILRVRKNKNILDNENYVCYNNSIQDKSHRK